jgi:hypothetical protein
MQDATNVGVYLPRQLGAGEFVVFAGVIFLGLGLLFYMGGERVQEVVEEKSAPRPHRHGVLRAVPWSEGRCSARAHANAQCTAEGHSLQRVAKASPPRARASKRANRSSMRS